MTGLVTTPVAVLDAPPLSFAPSTFRMHQRVRYEYSRPVRQLHQRLVVVPRPAHSTQRVSSWTLTVTGAGANRRVDRTDRFGNHVVEVTASDVDDHVEFALDCDVDVLPAGPAAPVGPRQPFLDPTPLTAPDDALRRLAAQTGPHAAAICDAVHAAFRYEWGITSVATTAAEAYAGGVGVCQDYAHVMLAVARAAGLPARYVSGHLLGDGGSHAWVEIVGRRAVEAWDPTHRRRAGAGYLTVAVGRDYADVAPFQGTFSGSGVESTLAVEKSLVRLAG